MKKHLILFSASRETCEQLAQWIEQLADGALKNPVFYEMSLDDIKDFSSKSTIPTIFCTNEPVKYNDFFTPEKFLIIRLSELSANEELLRDYKLMEKLSKELFEEVTKKNDRVDNLENAIKNAIEIVSNLTSSKRVVNLDETLAWFKKLTE